jgi:hypothetical protein
MSKIVSTTRKQLLQIEPFEPEDPRCFLFPFAVMSSNKTPAASAPLAPEAPFFTFPPFPEVPADSGLVPFKDFRPSGIQISVSGDEEIEVDGLGIPTVELRVKHDTDEPKTGKKKKKKSKSAKNAGLDGEPVKRLTWWEDWEEGEDLRVSSTGYSS